MDQLSRYPRFNFDGFALRGFLLFMGMAVHGTFGKPKMGPGSVGTT